MVEMTKPTHIFSYPMDPQSASTAPPITIPSATTDELLHALSATIISQHATITLLSGVIMQLYSSANHMTVEEATDLWNRILPLHLASANQGFVATIHERRTELLQRLHQ